MKAEELKKKIKKIRDVGCVECYCEVGQKQPYNCDVCKMELRVLRGKLKGFLAGQLAERERCLKMIEEVYEDEPVYVQEVEKIINRIFDKITKKIKEMKG